MRRLILGFTLLACALAAPAYAATDAAASYPAGQFYTTVDNPLPPADPAKISVQEFFWYGCPHCFRLEPLVEAWIPTLPADVAFERVPDALGQAIGALHQKAYYVEKVTGIESRVHLPLFDAIQVQRLPLNTEAALRAFFVKTGGITADQFNDAWNGFTVDSSVRRADALALHDRILAVPTLVIDGRYKLEGGLPGYAAMKGTETDHYRTMLKVADSLIAKVRAQRKATGVKAGQ